MEKHFLLALIIFFSINSFAQNDGYTGSRARDVWTTVISNPYFQLPANEVTYRDLYEGSISLIKRSASRTIDDRNDLLPHFKKLAHPNGICLKGVWEITAKNPYSGLFKKNSQAIIIARASVAMNETEIGHLRGFGFAGKLFPTMNDDEIVETANFFLIDDLGGTKAEHYTDVEMLNEPKSSITSAVFASFRYVVTVAKAFFDVDINPGKRQVYEVAAAGLLPGEKVSVPKWMMVRAAKKQEKVHTPDFRNELSIENNSEGLVFDIFVASKKVAGDHDWNRIGAITFAESMASESCDHNLHFHHPKWRDDLE